jgi:cellulose biosynthesis protein BcsQ
MSAKVVAIANRKGGVGKTTLGLSLAEGLAALKNRRILVVDLDSQINMSTLVVGGTPVDQVPWKTGKSIVDLIEKKASNAQTKTSFFICRDVLDHQPGRAVSLLSGDPRLMGLERRLLVRPNTTVEKVLALMGKVIDDVLAEHADHYDVILFDCPPGFSMATEAALARADLVILPTAPTMLATQGIQAYVHHLENDLNIADAAARTRVFLTMTGRTNTSATFERLIRAEVEKPTPRYQVFDTSYAYSVGFQEATDRRDQNIMKVRAIWRSLDRVRGRTMFHRLYKGVWKTVDKAVSELSDVLELKGAGHEGSTTRKSVGGSFQHEARP